MRTKYTNDGVIISPDGTIQYGSSLINIDNINNDHRSNINILDIEYASEHDEYFYMGSTILPKIYLCRRLQCYFSLMIFMLTIEIYIKISNYAYITKNNTSLFILSNNTSLNSYFISDINEMNTISSLFTGYYIILNFIAIISVAYHSSDGFIIYLYIQYITGFYYLTYLFTRRQ